MATQGKDWRSFDGRELEDGQVLVPQRITLEAARDMGVVMENLRTWTIAGVRYTVMFVPVRVDKEAGCWKEFYSELNEYLDEKLGPERCGRHVVSLDALLEEGYLPAGAAASAETIALEGVLLGEMIAELGKKNALLGEVIRLGYQGMDRKGIADKLPVKKSQAYDVIRKCREEVEWWLK